ncbi:MAG: YlbF family regulator [Clostridiales bacterium]|nr:YlbF family regulator [Clostridiales bacterium]
MPPLGEQNGFINRYDSEAGTISQNLAACRKEHTDMEYSQAHLLARDIRQSEEYQTYHGLKDEVMADETTAALIREYKKLQVTLQMAAMSGSQPDPDDMQRFQGITALLFSKPEVSQYLLAEMRLQQALADIFKIITEAADIDMSLPGME